MAERGSTTAEREKQQPSHCGLMNHRVKVAFGILLLVTLLMMQTDVLSIFSSWLRRQRPEVIVLLLFGLMIVDVIPVVGHPFAKPIQLVLPFVFDAVPAALLLVTYVWSSCMLALFLGRQCFRVSLLRALEAEWPEAARYKNALDRALGDPSAGLRLVVLMRLAPIPEMLLSYLLAFTEVSTSSYAVAAMVEAVKSTLITFYIAFNIRQGRAALLGETKATTAGQSAARSTGRRLDCSLGRQPYSYKSCDSCTRK